MAYTKLTSLSNIQAYYGGTTFTSSTAVTDTQVNNWIDQATSIIYGVLEKRYVIPVTDSDDLLQLEPIADMYVNTNITRALGPRQLMDFRNKDTLKRIDTDHSKFYKILEKYENGQINLVNTDNTTKRIMASSYNSDNSIESCAKFSEVQW